MTIIFNSIPANIMTPGVFTEYDNTRAVQGSPDIPNVALIIGQRLAAGTVDAEVPTLVASKTNGETYFGHGSMVAQMVEKFKAANAYTELWVIALDDEGAGVAATGTFTFAGSSTEAGSVYQYVGGERVVTAIPSGTAAAAAGPLVTASMTEHLLTSNLPVSSASPVAVQTITALHKGTLGNGIKLELNYNAGEVLPAGLTCAVVQMSAGATDPDVADAIAVFSDAWYTNIVSAYADDTNQDLLEAEIERRWGPMVQKDGYSYIGGIGNQSALIALGNARNSQFSTLMGGGLSPTPAWIWASVVGGVDAAETTPARPRQTLLLPGIMPPKPADRFEQSERNTLLSDGVSTFTISQDGRVYIERLITTYQTNSGGIVDPSYKDRTTMHSLFFIRYTWNAAVNMRYPRHMLADDGATFDPGQPIVTPAKLKRLAVGLFINTWVPKSVVDPSSLEQFKTDARFERDTTNVNQINLVMSPDLMNALMTTAAQIQFLL